MPDPTFDHSGRMKYRHLKTAEYAELLDYVLTDTRRYRPFLEAHLKLLDWFRNYHPEWDTAHSPGRRDMDQVAALHLMRLYNSQYARRPSFPKVAYRTELLSKPLPVGSTVRWKHPTGKRVSSWSENDSHAPAHTDVKLEGFTEGELRRRRLYEVFFRCRPAEDQVVWRTTSCAPVIKDAREFVLIDYPVHLSNVGLDTDDVLGRTADLLDRGLDMLTRSLTASGGRIYDEREVVLVTDRIPLTATVVSIRKIS
jgi:hypothetical protein